MVSPATGHVDTEWFDVFWAECQKLGCRIDYLATHLYRGTPDERIEKLKKYSERYDNKKIWLTEFAVIREKEFSKVIEFIEELLPKLEFSDFIFRYSWFYTRYYDVPTDTSHWFWIDNYAASLLDMNDSLLSQIGNVYDKPWHLEEHRPLGY